MRLSSISDVHISPNFPERMEMFHRFCKSKIVKDSHIIVLLGDIFDHMAGQKLQYLSQYKEYFELLTTILNDGKKLIIVEGNHDFHTDQIYMNAFKDCVGSENLKKLHTFKKG
jgi:UDP-2,3-diacylglucosamine pyrophosphatase LpxH